MPFFSASDDSNMDAKSELSQDNVNPTEVRRKKKTFKVHPYKGKKICIIKNKDLYLLRIEYLIKIA